MTRESTFGVFPAVTVYADVLEADRRIGEDLKSATTGAFAKGEVLAEVDVTGAGGDHHRKKERNRGYSAPPEARWKPFLRWTSRNTCRCTRRKPVAA